MDRREMIGIVGAGAIGLTTLASREGRADEPSAKLDEVHKECLEACGDCARACDMAANHCLDQVALGNKSHARPLRFTTDCAGFCTLAATNIARHSPLMAISCEACGSACRETLGVVSSSDLPEMKAAIVALERCEKSCRAMIEAMGRRPRSNATTPRAN